MPDQFRYWHSVNELRSGELGFIAAFQSRDTVLTASALLALVPLPTPVSIISLGFYNTFLYIVLFLVLYVKNVFTRVSLWFYLLFPSVALYTALSLRETLIFFFMVLTVTYARESKVFKSVLCIAPLYVIKFQNFFILGPIVLLCFIFNVAKKGVGFTKATVIAAIGLAGLLLSAPFAIPLVSFFRVAMFVEDGGEAEDITLITGAADFVLQGLTSAIYFLVKLFPWEASSALQLIQSVENLAILIILFLVTRQAWRKFPDKLTF